jgi:Fur family ferric uptake transcriptional regulator
MSMPTTRGQWAEHALRALRESGRRRSRAREAIVALLAEQRCALSAQQIDYQLRRRGGRAVGRATVYRALDQLSDLGLVTRVDVGQGTACYEPLPPGGEHHHHLVCDRCGRLTPFDDVELERTIDRISRHASFTVREHDVVLRGVCDGCRPALAQ